jgi:hypothetical protein
MALTNTWDRTAPADSDSISAGAGEIRSFKIDVEDRLGHMSDRFASFEAAVTALGSEECTLVVTESDTVLNNTTVPANIKLKFIPEVTLTVADTKTLTINSDNVEAGDWLCFAKAAAGATIAFAAGSTVRSTWFVDIATAYGALPAGGGTLIVPACENDSGDTSGVGNNVYVVDYRVVSIATPGKNKAVFAENDGKINGGWIDTNDFDDTLAGAGLVASGGVLAVNADASSLEIASDVLQVKAGGLVASHFQVYTAAAAASGGKVVAFESPLGVPSVPEIDIGGYFSSSAYLYPGFYSTNGTYELVAEFFCPIGGTLWSSFSLTRGGVAGTVYGRLYVDGVATGTEASTTTSTTRTDSSVTVAAGSLIQLYARATAGASSPARIDSWTLRSSTGFALKPTLTQQRVAIRWVPATLEYTTSLISAA